MADRVTIFDTTLRDGEQAPGFSLRVPEKLQLARHLDRLGVDVIEAGFPIASDADAEAVRVVAAELDRPVVAALARCRPDDIERAGEALTRGQEPAHSHVHRHFGPASRTQAAHQPRAVPATPPSRR